MLTVVFAIGLSTVAQARKGSSPSCAPIITNRTQTFNCHQTEISDTVERSGNKVKNWLAYEMKLKLRPNGRLHVYMQSNYLFLDKDFSYEQAGNNWVVNLTDPNHLELRDAQLNIQWKKSEALVTFTHSHPVGTETVRFTCSR